MRAGHLGAAWVLAQVAVAVAHAEPTGPLQDTVPSVVVEGEARRETVPDMAIVTLGVVTDRATAAQASSDNAVAANAIVATARKAGLVSTDIRTATLTLATVTDPRDASKVRAFRATNQVTLRVHALAGLGSLIGELTAQGANDIVGIGFALDHPDPMLDELRAEATRDARRKADVYAAATGSKLGRVLRIAPDGAGSTTPMPRAFKLQMAAEAPPPPVEAGTETLETRVQVTWELVP